jgi:hypothetical protein
MKKYYIYRLSNDAILIETENDSNEVIDALFLLNTPITIDVSPDNNSLRIAANGKEYEYPYTDLKVYGNDPTSALDAVNKFWAPWD